MPVVKKKKKKKLGGLGSRGGVSSREQSPYRPYFLEKLAPCMQGCPQGTNIRGILTTIAQAEKDEKPYEQAFEEVWYQLTENNPLPAVCGRVCPHPCEDNCNRQHKESAVGINSIERFIGDYGLEQKFQLKKNEETYPEKIAIVGSGPAGISCAYHLAKRGYSVTIFESFPKPGGMLRYGIPAYRLPRQVLDAEINNVLKLGVDLKCDTTIGKDILLDDLRKQYDAIFVGIGAHKGIALGIDGEDAPNIFTGTTFLREANSGYSVEIGDKVAVIGGGDTAIDAARVSKRMGAKEVTILYRRTRKEMPAIEEEIVGAEEEGIKIEYLVAPVKLIKDGEKVVKVVCQRMELGEPDDSGRRRPVPIEGSEFEVEISSLIAAISQRPDMDPLSELSDNGKWIQADEKGITENENVYAGGDVLELGLVTIAIYQGRRGAETIHNKLREIEEKPAEQQNIIKADKMLLSYYEEKMRQECEMVPIEERFKNPDMEIKKGLTREQVIEEASRCMSCGSCFDCGTCWSYCQDGAIEKPLIPGQSYKFKLEFCTGCKKCAENCPCGYIELQLK